MLDNDRLRSWMSWSRWSGELPAVLAAMMVGTVVLAASGGLVEKLSTIAAAALLAGVTQASLQVVRQWRTIADHASIRADIAAAGGLGQRLSV
jgi:hypothetical protein